MKKFTKYLAIGIAIAIVAALGICYFVWSLHSMHRLIWFFIVFAICAFTCRYLYDKDYVECDNPKGKTDYDKVQIREMTKWEQIGVVLKSGIGCAILGTLVWTIGYGISCLFDWHPDFWEMHLLYGAITVGAICLTIYVGCAIWVFFLNIKSPHVRKAMKSVLMWIAVILCSLAVVGAIFYFLFPLAVAS